MILHIVIDDKFIDTGYRTFEEVNPDNNKFVLISKPNKLNYIKNIPIEFIHPKKALSNKFLNSLKVYDFVVLHWLDDMKMQLVLKAPKDVKFLWIGWGGDYYKYIKKDLLLPLTRKSIENNYNKGNMLSELKVFKNNIKKYINRNKRKDIGKIVNRINYFAPVLEEDYHLLSKDIDNFRPKYIDWNYGSIEDLIPNKENNFINGNNILIGNSGYCENNHIDAFELLNSIELNGRKVICPLSYGDKTYTSIVINKGNELFGDNLIALLSFLPLQEYISIIKSCSIVIMNHLRQQALGNINIMMFIGAKVFLNKENPIYSFYLKHGAVIYNTDELNNDIISYPLNKTEINKNREILFKLWNRENMLLKTKKLINTIKEGIQ